MIALQHPRKRLQPDIERAAIATHRDHFGASSLAFKAASIPEATAGAFSNSE